VVYNGSIKNVRTDVHSFLITSILGTGVTYPCLFYFGVFGAKKISATGNIKAFLVIYIVYNKHPLTTSNYIPILAIKLKKCLT
jgi:hypothetical protein